MIRKSKKARQRARMVKQLDAEARVAVFDRDGYRCVRCGSEKGPQWAHIFSRRHKNLRWLAVNAVTFCAGCHMWWHQYPLLAVEWFRKNYPQRYEEIMAIFNAGEKVTMASMKEMLQ